MIQKAETANVELQRRIDKILAALIRARARACEIARQTGTPVVYMRDGKLVEEYMTDGTEADQEKTSP